MCTPPGVKSEFTLNANCCLFSKQAVWPSCCFNIRACCVRSPPAELASSRFWDSWMWFGELDTGGERYQSRLDVPASACLSTTFIRELRTHDLTGIYYKSVDFVLYNLFCLDGLSQKTSQDLWLRQIPGCSESNVQQEVNKKGLHVRVKKAFRCTIE